MSQAPFESTGTRRVREIASLDLMRLAAAQLVMFYHFVFLSWAEGKDTRGIRALVGDAPRLPEHMGWSSPGWVGVQVFFVISGFVILMSAEGKSANAFLIGRVKRILPALWFFSLLAAVVMIGTGILSPAEASVRLARSMVLFPMGPWIDGAVWTLVVEALFYAAIYVFIRCRMIGNMTGIAIAMTLFNILFWGTVLAGSTGLLGASGQWIGAAASSYKLQVTLVTTNCYFVLGASLYQIFKKERIATNAMVYAINFVACLISTYFAALHSIGVSQHGQNPLAAAALWGGLVIVLTACVLLRLGAGERFRRFAAIAGLLTYPLYLTNQITGGFLLGLAYRLGLPPMVTVIGVALLCTVLAGLFAILLERRMQDAVGRLLEKVMRPALA
ncbi:acyltransferase [Novosphingobium sp. BL-8A]|uniref:acyltransferase family protein n=1 Tax=Novosphingobium sp. BL-8A TaxID=3127639 RepID=UPI003756FF00